MKKYLPYIVVFLVGLLIGWLPKGRLQKDTIVHRDTIVVHDTIEYTKEVLAEKTKVVYKDKVEYVYVDVEKTDTLYIEKKVYVQMPRQYYLTETDDVRIWHSGIDSTIDSLNVVRKTQNITETIQKRDMKNAISIGVNGSYYGSFMAPVYLEYRRRLRPWISLYGRFGYDIPSGNYGVCAGTEITISW
jgi:hypothetical protein